MSFEFSVKSSLQPKTNPTPPQTTRVLGQRTVGTNPCKGVVWTREHGDGSDQVTHTDTDRFLPWSVERKTFGT